MFRSFARSSASPFLLGDSHGAEAGGGGPVPVLQTQGGEQAEPGRDGHAAEGPAIGAEDPVHSHGAVFPAGGGKQQQKLRGAELGEDIPGTEIFQNGVFQIPHGVGPPGDRQAGPLLREQGDDAQLDNLAAAGGGAGQQTADVLKNKIFAEEGPLIGGVLPQQNGADGLQVQLLDLLRTAELVIQGGHLPGGRRPAGS